MKRLHSLDALRGVAALSVVVWHWQHFFALTGTWQDGWQRGSQPFYWALKPLYDGGWMAVDLFFALSGFVFFWLYAQAIREGRIGAGRFAVLRLSRLYPLHFATLILAAGLEYLFQRQTGQYFIFESGDGLRFAAGLVMAQQWMPPTDGQFFNGPAWSVSVEVLLYILFFAACRLGLTGPRQAAAIALAAIFLLPVNEPIARGVIGFFLGGAVFHAVTWTMARRDAARIARGAAVAAGLCWLGVIVLDYASVLPPVSDDGLNVPQLGFIFLVSPATIAALALHEKLYGGSYRLFSFLGDISYSTYLLHFPLQLICVLAALHYGWTPKAFMHPWAMIAFFAALIALGAASHVGFERPMQKLLRGAFTRPAAVAETI